MRTLAIGLVAILAARAGWSQIRGGGGGSIGGGAPPGGISGRSTTGTNPNSPSIGDNSSLDQRPLFFSGRVVLSDGAALPQPAKIERACGETSRVQAYTDLKGRFSFQTGQNTELPDVSDRSGPSGGSFGVPSRGRDRSQLDCELRITLPGFRPETVSLANARYLDNPDLGTIILRRIANVDGLTVSATSSLAPKDARKAYEKGEEALNKKNAAEAQKDFEKATEIYPRYAAAWYELGRLDEQKSQFDEARRAYGQAVTADAKYIPPHERLAWIALRETKWQEVADDTEIILRLDPIDYPDAYYLSGVANLQLGNLDAAEKSAREAVERDTNHRNARAPYVLGLILAQKHDYAGAVPLLRAFLERNPDVADAPAVRQQLEAIEQAARGNTSSSQENPVQDK